MAEDAGVSAILIAGSSHVGKTTLAKKLSDAPGWRMISTDGLARHPGRPWPTVRPQVAEFYDRLSPETIYWFLRVHHENMWPGIQRLIEDELGAERRFVLEGSALRPEFVAPLLSSALAGICLYAARRAIMDKFIDRSLRDNSEIRAAAEEHGLRLIDAADPAAVEDVFQELIGAAR